MRKYLVGALVLIFLAAGCTSGKTTSAGGTSTSGTSGGSSAEASRAPGVTPTSIKIGVTYVDEEAVKASGLDLNLGDYQKSYQTLIDKLNAAGGIDGRKIEVVFAPINPIGTAPADAACLKLTQDEKVFVAVGFFLNNAVLCPVETQNTAVIGGGQTPELMARAKAPWFTTNPGSEVPVAVVNLFHQKKLLEGKVAVFAQVADADLMNNQILPELEKLGVKPVDHAILDAPAGDTAAITSGTQTIAQRFKAEGATKVLLVGPSSADWFLGMQDQSYQPQLLISDSTGVNAFLSNAATHNTSLLKDAVSGSTYGPDSWSFDEPNMKSCLATLKAAGIDVPRPDPKDPNQKAYTGPQDACVNLALLKAILTKAGKDLNYATFRAAGYSLGKVNLPGDPSPRTFGPPPATDGAPQPFLSDWDAAKKAFVPQES